ncbi:flagellar hook protein FlgE [Rhodospirillaceae bacterium]|nr:flagellar hook protein FlgE [Alphaproteobacteria bacterium]MDC1442674.1 flagellar hook protein FlgE [Rhodospirillaceae bacterium]
MSINSGLFAGVAAVAAQSTAFAVISDNIANVNTVGFKDTTTQFQALVTQSLSTSASAGGVKSITQTDPIKQGLLQGTENSTDVAIDGNGFFVTNEAAIPGIGDEYLLTRAGNFIKDEDDKLVNSAGFYLQGYATTGTGAIENNNTRDLLSSLETVDLSKFQRVAKVTTTVELNLNLNAAAADADVNDITNLTVYDSQGNDYLLRLSWDKTATANIWDCVATIEDPAAVLASVAETGTAAKATGFRVEFNTDGTPKTITAVGGGGAATTGAAGTAATTTIGFTAAAVSAVYTGRATDNLSFTVNFGNYGTSSGITQYDAPYQTSLLNQDGNGPTDLERVSFDDKGLLTAVFSDGSSRPIYKLPIATVPAPSELEALSGNAYRITANSGEAVLNFATEGGAGRVSASALENSTVDIAGQFTDLIIAQRAYSAATKIITTGDELLEEITRVKR